MTNSIALVLGLVIVGLIGFDVIWLDSANIVFLAKKMMDLIEWMAFWR